MRAGGGFVCVSVLDFGLGLGVRFKERVMK